MIGGRLSGPKALETLVSKQSCALLTSIGGLHYVALLACLFTFARRSYNAFAVVH